MFLVSVPVLVSEVGVLVNEAGVLVNEAGAYPDGAVLTSRCITMSGIK